MKLQNYLEICHTKAAMEKKINQNQLTLPFYTSNPFFFFFCLELIPDKKSRNHNETLNKDTQIKITGNRINRMIPTNREAKRMIIRETQIRLLNELHDLNGGIAKEEPNQTLCHHIERKCK